jgi:hypothetical protein
MSYDWYSNDATNKKARRQAADDFLNELFDNENGPLWTSVVGDTPAKRAQAYAHFNAHMQAVPNGGPIPANVDVVCIEDDTRSLADLVVFVMVPRPGHANIGKKDGKEGKESKKAGTTRATVWRKRWIAAWVPY